MAVRGKTRKVLWGRSGNRCAICRQELVVDATDEDAAAVIGDECHIVSGQGLGPRFDSTYPTDDLDKEENLILLCRVHHKMVDDQPETYTVDVLRTLKSNHETWVASALTEDEKVPPLKIRRIRENTPEHLIRLTSGRAVLSILRDAHASAFEHDDLASEAEVDLVGGFLQEAQDIGDMYQELEPGDRVRTVFDLDARLKELEQAGFWVFGAREVGRIEGGVGSPSAWNIAILQVLRADNANIREVDLSAVDEQEVE